MDVSHGLVMLLSCICSVSLFNGCSVPERAYREQHGTRPRCTCVSLMSSLSIKVSRETMSFPPIDHEGSNFAGKLRRLDAGELQKFAHLLDGHWDALALTQ